MSPWELLTFLLVGSVCLGSLVDGQKKNKPPRWKPKSRPFNGDNIIAMSSGSDIKISCPAYGNPKPKITWYKEENLFDASQRPKTKARHFALTLYDVQTSDSGKYKCVVQNSLGSLEFTFIVDVIRTSWPLELEEPRNATVMEGERVVFRCRALNDPYATTQWIKRNTDGGDSGGSNWVFLPSNGPEILIENARPEDAGKYTCMVGNYIGIKSVDVWLTVRQTTTTTTSTTQTSTTTTERKITTSTTNAPLPTTTVKTFPNQPDTTDDEDLEGGSRNVMDDDIYSNSGNPDNDRLPINRDTYQDFPAGTQQHAEEEEGLSARTMYTIVGIVAGGTLLVGLVVILVAHCYNRTKDRIVSMDTKTPPCEERVSSL
ncbi:fibroblast growth factor receptor 4-like isoform X2 [Saccostrea cucullata]|uniref:fibroblast growth factor receptor 4-like isoform X2 n=1 Tax=Saccostrea cuccullata TaxID=36930 RepID=UPI002ED289CF